MKDFFVILIVAIGFSQCQKEKLLVDKIRNNFLNAENDLWNFALHSSKENAIDPGLELVRKFKDFDEQVQLMPQDILYGMDEIRKSEYFLLIFSDVRVISDLYEKFRRYQKDLLSTTKNDYSLYRQMGETSHIVEDILNDPKNNVNKTVLDIYNRVFNGSSLIGDLYENLIYAHPFTCNYLIHSRQQVFYNLYNLIALTDLKGYIMTQFAYMALRLQETGNHSELSLAARSQYEERTLMLTTDLALYMNSQTNKMHRCDPKVHVEGKTYTQLTQLIQAHIENEADMNPASSCKQTCSTYSSATSYRCYDSSSEYCNKRKPCNGKIYDCRFMQSHFTTCISPSNSLRRYEFIDLKNKVLGEKTYCSNRDVDSWTRWFVHCSYCLCFCDQQGPESDRYFNLRPVRSDTASNKVVTGMRLIKHNRIIHIQIQEGKLLPHGYIDQNTTRWVPVDNYKITNNGVKRGSDYHTMDYFSRSLYLDTVKTTGQNTLITGVKFVMMGSGLRLQIIETPFDFSTGRLHDDETSELMARGTRRKLLMEKPNIPIYSKESKKFDTNTYFIDFTHTDLDADAGQTTVPFIDIQPVYSDPAVPLNSAAIYYKGGKGSGGFIGMEIGTFEYSDKLQFDFPKAKSRVDSEEVFSVLPA
ncbi:unnamed protein product [Phyllotreta striolata]|uniref:Uncharacterized protein n=1 Tax=Phyllotreta striolata TaxID=444603 RepID=A0A9N9TUW8_PHYSR|nr:unnamed protein product [Phyllotreta striolata]